MVNKYIECIEELVLLLEFEMVLLNLLMFNAARNPNDLGLFQMYVFSG